MEEDAMTSELLFIAAVITLCILVGVVAAAIFGAAFFIEIRERWFGHHMGGHHHLSLL